MSGPVIAEERCDGCRLCVEVCGRGGFVGEDGKVRFVESADCDYCGECEACCPGGAISIYYDIVMAAD